MAIWRRTILLVACALSVLAALPVAAAEQPIAWVVQGKSTTLAKAAGVKNKTYRDLCF